MLLYLGTIAIPANSSKNNRTTSGSGTAAFIIPASTKAIRFLQSAAGAHVEVKPDPVDASTFATDATKGLDLGDPAGGQPPGLLGSLPLPLVAGGAPNVLAVYNSTGAPITVKVWACMPAFSP